MAVRTVEHGRGACGGQEKRVVHYALARHAETQPWASHRPVDRTDDARSDSLRAME